MPLPNDLVHWRGNRSHEYLLKPLALAMLVLPLAIPLQAHEQGAITTRLGLQLR
jgi:hypothetical protein